MKVREPFNSFINANSNNREHRFYIPIDSDER